MHFFPGYNFKKNDSFLSSSSSSSSEEEVEEIEPEIIDNKRKTEELTNDEPSKKIKANNAPIGDMPPKIATFLPKFPFSNQVFPQPSNQPAGPVPFTAYHSIQPSTLLEILLIKSIPFATF